MTAFQEYHIKKDLKEYSPMGKLEELRLLKNEEKLPWTVLAGAGGMNGKNDSTFRLFQMCTHTKI